MRARQPPHEGCFRQSGPFRAFNNVRIHLGVPLPRANHRGKRPRDEPRHLAGRVTIPAYGRVKVSVAFRDFRGRPVCHCHILYHEDLGMMGAIEVL